MCRFHFSSSEIVPSNKKKDETVKYFCDFCITSELIQIIDDPKRIRDIVSHHGHLFHATCPEKRSSVESLSFRSSVHSLVSVKIDADINCIFWHPISIEHVFLGHIFDNTKPTVSFRSFISIGSLSIFFKTEKCIPHIRADSFWYWEIYPSQDISSKSQISQPWYTP